MSLSAELDLHRISVLLDLRHPLACLALHPTLVFARARSLAPNWLPLTVPTLRPPSRPGPEDDRGVRHRRSRARAIAREIETYAAAQGRVIREPYRDVDASAANRGWLWLRDRHRALLEPYLVELFRAYWSLELDPSDDAEIARLIGSLGEDPGGFEAWSRSEGPAAVESLAGELRAFGLFQVPAFVVEDEVFYGRQHLPMIDWILAGRSGPVPI